MARAGDDVAFGLENLEVPAGQIWPRVDAALAAVAVPVRAGRTRPTSSPAARQQRLVLAGTFALEPVAAAARRADREPRPRSARRWSAAVLRTSLRADAAHADHGRAPRGRGARPRRPRRRARARRRRARRRRVRSAVFAARGASWRRWASGCPSEPPPAPRRGHPGAASAARRARSSGSAIPPPPRPPLSSRPTSTLRWRRGAGGHRAERLGQVDARPAAGRAARPVDRRGGRPAPTHGTARRAPLHRWPARVLATPGRDRVPGPGAPVPEPVRSPTSSPSGPRLAGFDDADGAPRVDDLLERLVPRPPGRRRTRSRCPAARSAGCRSPPRSRPTRRSSCSTSRRSVRTGGPGSSCSRCCDELRADGHGAGLRDARRGVRRRARRPSRGHARRCARRTSAHRRERRPGSRP